jgi:6-phosphogluconolactonase (cycloisomerase 2 family)
VANYTGGGLGTLSQFSIGSDGSLTPLAVPTVNAGNGPVWIAIDSAGQFAYAVNLKANTVSQFAVGADGSLTPLSTPTVATGTSPFAIAIVN